MLFASLKTAFLVSTLCFSTLLFASTISKQEASASAQQAYSGRVLSVKLKKSTYKVKIINSKGQVRVIKVNASNGKIK